MGNRARHDWIPLAPFTTQVGSGEGEFGLCVLFVSAHQIMKEINKSGEMEICSINKNDRHGRSFFFKRVLVFVIGNFSVLCAKSKP
jgi:hypothetical protein